MPEVSPLDTRVRRRALADRFTRRDRFRFAGLALIVYGLFGISILTVGALTVSGALGQIRGLGGSIEEQRAAVLRSLETTSDAIARARTSLGNVGTSLEQARRSSDNAATVARDVSNTMTQLGTTMRSVTVFNVAVLEGVAPDFERAGQQLGALATDIDTIGTALGQNTTDTRAMAEDLERLRTTVVDLTRLVRETPALANSASAVTTLGLVLYALIGWMLALAFAALFAGIALWRAAGRVT